MATAYAALTSLMHLIKDLHDHPCPPIKLDEKHVYVLNSEISFFQRFLEEHHENIDLEVEIRIARAARAVEDLIEAHIGEPVPDFNKSLERAIHGFHRNKVSTTDQEKPFTPSRFRDGRHLAMPFTPSRFRESNTAVVGIEDLAIQIMDRLTSSQHNKSERQIISISGMGGIGKTTLARTVYDRKLIKDYFDVCAWVTISKDYDALRILAEVLAQIRSVNTGEEVEINIKLGFRFVSTTLYKALIGRSYLVVLDDAWDVNAWDTLRPSFPAGSKSRILMTTREEKVASISSHNFDMRLLDEVKSWDLLCNCAFGKDIICPPELELVGKYVARKSRGLPLSIVMIGGHLAKSPRTYAYWEYIADNLSSVVNSENDEHCLKVLSLSYDHLPLHLKPCFLSMGIFPEGKDIRVSDVVKLWMVEGILKPIEESSLEEAAEQYLKDLVARNLVLASTLSKTGKMRSVKMHDLLRDLCLRIETKKDSRFRVVQKQRLRILESYSEQQISLDGFGETRRVRVGTLTVRGQSESETGKLLQRLPLGGGSLTMADNHTIDYSNLANVQCLELNVHARPVYYRYVPLRPDSPLQYAIPRLACFLWNLRSLVMIVGEDIHAPPDIWKMPQLRKIVMRKLYFPDLPSESIDILRNLQRAGRLMNFKFSRDFAERVPNVKKLKVGYDDSSHGVYTLYNVALLEKLESFDCSFSWMGSKSRTKLMLGLTYPHSLKKLNIDYLDLEDVVMTTKIGSLPLLEVLKLSNCSGREWKVVEGLFVRLKYLELKHSDNLQRFTAGNGHFPCLRELRMQTMIGLKEIPSDIGDIDTLVLIELNDCSDSAVVSAKAIADVKLGDGDEELQVKARLARPTGLSREMMLCTSNFHVHQP